MPYILAAVFSAGLFTGFQIETWHQEVKEAQIIREKEAELQKFREKSRKLEENLIAEKQNIKTVEKKVIRYVPKYITAKQHSPDSECAINSDIIRLLEAARLSKATSSVTATDTETASTEELINYTIGIITRYNAAAAQCNALIQLVKNPSPK